VPIILLIIAGGLMLTMQFATDAGFIDLSHFYLATIPSWLQTLGEVTGFILMVMLPGYLLYMPKDGLGVGVASLVLSPLPSFLFVRRIIHRDHARCHRRHHGHLEEQAAESPVGRRTSMNRCGHWAPSPVSRETITNPPSFSFDALVVRTGFKNSQAP